MLTVKNRALFLICAVGFSAAFANTASAWVIVGWDAARGGEASLSDSAHYSSVRNMINTDYPGSTLIGVSTLTSADLAGANVVWIGSGYAAQTTITPLTASEQTALLDFVKSGGKVLLFGENDYYGADALAANNSLFPAALGVHNSGNLGATLGANAAYTLPAPGDFPMTGHWGTITALSSGFPGWFDQLPVGAEVAATLANNGQPVIAHLLRNSISDGSGHVWVFSDSGGAWNGGTESGQWNTLYANILYEPVPEPSSLTLLGLGGAGLLIRRRRR